MVGYDCHEAREWILSQIDPKPFRAIQDRMTELIEDFIQYDFHFMRVSGVLDENDCQGEQEYDEDEAFEFIYDAYLSDHPQDEDDDMMVAALLNRYMELQSLYLEAHGLSGE
ncbi:MAG: hypothetical protein PHI98_09055 [Eubacteriales bacterium]|nr:hypothetical protein [Eubacteriales bacterium]